MKKKHIIVNIVVPLLLWILFACGVLGATYITEGVVVFEKLLLISLPSLFSLFNAKFAKNEWFFSLNNLIFMVSNTVGHAIFCWATTFVDTIPSFTEKIVGNFSFIPLCYTLVLTLICFFVKRYHLID